MAEPRRTLPSSAGDIQLRRLGLGKSSGGGPLRGQVVVALVLVLIVLGVPLYVLRRPSLDHAAVDPQAAKSQPSAGVVRSKLDGGVKKSRVRVAEVQRIKCSASAAQQGNTGPECDPLPAFEDMLKQAVLRQVKCAPAEGGGTINFVLNVDFPARRIKVFPGKSGSWKGPQAKQAADCVEKAFPAIKWESITHRYRFYTLALMATYEAPATLDVLPTFE